MEIIVTVLKILAFAGTSLSILVLDYAYELPWLQIINSNNIRIAVMQGLKAKSQEKFNLSRDAEHVTIGRWQVSAFFDGVFASARTAAGKEGLGDESDEESSDHIFCSPLL